MYLEMIDTLKNELDSYRPFNEITVRSIVADLRLKYTYNSTAIEGNTLSIYETKSVIEDGITIGGKTVREHLEVINHDKAITRLIADVQNNVELDIKLILDYHNIILTGINDDWSGRFRNISVHITGASHATPSPHKVFDEMNVFKDRIRQEFNLMHPVIRAAMVHAEFVRIHPFVDGNGRTARLIMNLELMKAGYPIVIIEVEDKRRYCEALDIGCATSDYSKFIEFIAEKTSKSLNIYLSSHKDNKQFQDHDLGR